MNKMKPSQFDLVMSIFLYGAFPLALSIMAVYQVWMNSLFAGDYAARGQFGDQFGAVSALFTGVAFVGLVVTTALQAKGTRQQNRALELQQQTLEHQAEEFKAQRVELKRSAEAQEEAIRSILVQNGTLPARREALDGERSIMDRNLPREALSMGSES